MIGLGLPAGKLVDMGYVRQTLAAGSILYAFLYVSSCYGLICIYIADSVREERLFMVSLVHGDKYYQIFLAQGLGMGIGSSFLYLPALAIHARHWPKKHRPVAVGIVMSGLYFVFDLNVRSDLMI